VPYPFLRPFRYEVVVRLLCFCWRRLLDRKVKLQIKYNYLFAVQVLLRVSSRQIRLLYVSRFASHREFPNLFFIDLIGKVGQQRDDGGIGLVGVALLLILLYLAHYLIDEFPLLEVYQRTDVVGIAIFDKG